MGGGSFIDVLYLTLTYECIPKNMCIHKAQKKMQFSHLTADPVRQIDPVSCNPQSQPDDPPSVFYILHPDKHSNAPANRNGCPQH